MRPDTLPPSSIDPRLLRVLINRLHQTARLSKTRFPDLLEAAFLSRRSRDSQSFIRAGRPLLILSVVVLVFKNMLSHGELIAENHYFLVRIAYLPLSVAVLAILFGQHLPVIRERLYGSMLLFGSVAIYFITLTVLSVRQVDYAALAAVYAVITIALVIFGLRPVLYHLAPMITLTGVAALGTAVAMRWPVSLMHFLHYYGLYSLVMLALAAIAERQERVAFLQNLLVQQQSSELMTLNARLESLAHADGLTGLANRRAFDLHLEREWERARRDRQPLAVLFLDVDYFKRYNDARGHAAGDFCLQEVARTLRTTLKRAIDLPARYGGEEFVILLPATDLDGAREVADRILTAIDILAMPHPDSPIAGHVTASIGIASVVPEEQLSTGQLLRQADMALYRAKAAGRHGFAAHEEDSATAHEAAPLRDIPDH